jgi:hypothetical protein
LRTFLKFLWETLVPRGICVSPSGGHFGAGGCTRPARGDAFVHIADTLAIIRAFGADFRTFFACMFVMWSVDEHEVGRRPADFDARHHQAEMGRLNMLTAGLQAVIHRSGKADPVTIQAGFNASVHVF